MDSASEVGVKRRRGSHGASRLQSLQEDGPPQGGGDEEEGTDDPNASDASPRQGDQTGEPMTADREVEQESEPEGPPRRYGFGLSARSLMVSDDEGDDHGDGEDAEHQPDNENQDDEDDGDDEDEVMSADEEELEAILADEEEGLYPSEEAATSPFASAPVIYPRRLYKAARNVETVKDVTFLGAEKNYIGSGSDDGNFFVWSKEGKLEGIWEGDGSVVNVIEQHPSLPLCAVSGIDSTVKVSVVNCGRLALTGN